MGGKRGLLRVYLGAAPGVGKTYAMLGEARRRVTRGTDVVVGYRRVPRPPAHRGAALRAGDRAAVAPPLPGRRVRPRWTSTPSSRRHPQVAIVDELAHTNVPGGRNAKRWQDVEELLDAGIDVITTVNVQHLESLNDVVERITGVVQRETVPDAVVRAADQIELVDMSPEALRRRMAHGNVYAAGKVDAALANYFRVGNLTALRELALLWLADRVDEGLQRYRALHDIDETWEARERVVVALTGGPEGATPDPAGRPDRRAGRQRRPARPARRPQRRPDRSVPGHPGGAAHPGGVARRELPPRRRRRRPDRSAGIRQGGERDAACAGHEPTRPIGALRHRTRGGRIGHAALRRHRRPHGHPRALGHRRSAARTARRVVPAPHG